MCASPPLIVIERASIRVGPPHTQLCASQRASFLMSAEDKTRQTVVVAFDVGYQIHDKCCWRWIERWLLLDPAQINLVLLHVQTSTEGREGRGAYEFMSYRYIDIEESAHYLAYDVWKSLRRGQYPHHEVLVLLTNKSVSNSLVDFMKFDAPQNAVLVLGSRHHTPSMFPPFLLGSISRDVTAKLDSHAVLLIRTRLFKDVSDLRDDTVGSAYLGLHDEREFGVGRRICIAVDAGNVRSLVHYCQKELLRRRDVVQIIHCASDDDARTLARVSNDTENVREELKNFLDDEQQIDSILLDFSGDVRDRLIDHVNVEMEHSLDLLVIGRKRQNLARSVVGRTALYLLQHAHVPVLMVPDALLESKETAVAA